jgi:hypothetical protein
MPVKLYPFDPPLLEDQAVVDSPDVAHSEAQVDRLISKNEKLLLALEEAMAREQTSAGNADSAPKGKNTGNAFVNALKIVGSIAAIVGTLGGLGWGLHSEFSKVSERIDKIDKRMTNLTMAVKILGDAQGGKTKELVDDALTVAQMKNASGDTQAAARLLVMANELVAQEKQKRMSVSS